MEHAFRVGLEGTANKQATRKAGLSVKFRGEKEGEAEEEEGGGQGEQGDNLEGKFQKREV